jgi:hypothetical protein
MYGSRFINIILMRCPEPGLPGYALSSPALAPFYLIKYEIGYQTQAIIYLKPDL